jgi:sarcosine oxidase subunit alpha
MRIKEHPIIDLENGSKVSFSFDGKKIEGYKNDTIASALFASGISKYRDSLVLKRPRGFFCAIGKCSSCLMEVNNVPNVRICITPVEEGMIVKTQNSLPKMQNEVINEELIEEPEELSTDIAVVGGGPSGLEAALMAAKLGAQVALIEENYMLGGQLLKQTHKFFGSRKLYAGERGTSIAEKLIAQVKDNKNIKVMLNSSVSAIYDENNLCISEIHGKKCTNLEANRIIVATGASEVMLAIENNDLPGVYGAGAIQTLVNIYGIKIGKKVLIVGAGNVGLILAYHLLQAGIEVAAVIEGMPKIGGFEVHAAKIRRHGVPILTSFTLSSIKGSQKVVGATIVKLDENNNSIAGSEIEFDVDTIALAVGLQPNYRLCHQIGCQFIYQRELGGFVPIRDKYMRTSKEQIYIAGDSAGIEEATTAMMEGKIAGLSAAMSLGYKEPGTVDGIEELMNELDKFRISPRGIILKNALKKVII